MTAEQEAYYEMATEFQSWMELLRSLRYMDRPELVADAELRLQESRERLEAAWLIRNSIKV